MYEYITVCVASDEKAIIIGLIVQIKKRDNDALPKVGASNVQQ